MSRRTVPFAVAGCLLALAVFGPRSAGAEEPPKPGRIKEETVKDGAKEVAKEKTGNDFFEAKIRPVLVQHCYQCHSTTAGKSEGDLLLDSRKAIRAGGSRGPAVVPGDPGASILLTAIAHDDKDLLMPPKKDQLPAAVIEDFRKWIKLGAPDPREAPIKTAVKVAGPAVDLETGRKFWAFQRPKASPPPTTSNPDWAKRDLDHFILAKLDAAKVSPAPDAEPAVLLRRLHFDLVGLPPSPAATREFVKRVRKQGLDAALEKEVDSLLASERFGERWGRHWLDVARFGESSGKEANNSYPHAWRYRDYVIDCVNADMPFNRFLTEQIAGDLLPYDSDAERARLLIATGFLAVGTKNLDEMDVVQFAADIIDEQLDSVTRATIASSIACARCHDHKFDPFSMKDYYALTGIFTSTKTYFGTYITPINGRGGDPLPLPRVEGQKIFEKPITAKQAAANKAELAQLVKDAAEAKSIVDALRISYRTGGVKHEVDLYDDTGAARPLAMGALEADKIADVPLMQRGDVHKPGDVVPRGFPAVMELRDAAPIPKDHSGRLEFAQWLTHPDHPLTARVMVNRIWHHIFGGGLVRTVDNFGFAGERPSHPELLDELAIQFVKDGWSVKKLVRELVLSRTYRQASTWRNDAFQQDPDNRLQWRMPKRRLEAEAIRDAMLVASDELDVTRPAGSLVAKMGDKPIAVMGLDKSLPADLDGMLNRSVYLPAIRDRLPDVLELFDFAEASLVTGERDATNVPLQALYLMNSPFVQARAKALAKRLLAEADSEPKRIRRAFEVCYGRLPDAQEADMAARYLAKARAEAGDDEAALAQAFVSYCQALLSTAEFRNLD